MSNDVVGTDTGGESNALEKLAVALRVSLSEFLLNESITSSNDIGDLSTNNRKRLDVGKSLRGNFTSSLVLGNSLRVLKGVVNYIKNGDDENLWRLVYD